MRAVSKAVSVPLAVAMMGVFGGVGAATADPNRAPNAFLVPLKCDNGKTYTVIVNGNGEFTAAHDLDGTTTLVPTMFGVFVGTITDAEGNVVDQFEEPEVFKGSSSRQGGTTTTCTFEFRDTFEDPDLGTLHFHGIGTVTGFTTPAR